MIRSDTVRTSFPTINTRYRIQLRLCIQYLKPPNIRYAFISSINSLTDVMICLLPSSVCWSLACAERTHFFSARSIVVPMARCRIVTAGVVGLVGLTKPGQAFVGSPVLAARTLSASTSGQVCFEKHMCAGSLGPVSQRAPRFHRVGFACSTLILGLGSCSHSYS